MQRVSRRAWNLDYLFSFCGYRLGWTAVIGLLPLVGDVLNAYLSFTVIRLANRIEGGLPIVLLAQMTGNVVLDFLLGITPILGSIAGALYKANSRNSLVLEHYLKERARANLAKGLYSSSADKSPNQASVRDADPLLLRTVGKQPEVPGSSQQDPFS
ncbi:hypothetical protein D0Z00_003368 [Geotrichum galactomycetum]|uniref:Uncharacterized protein n=1 Tax=Geotrichum galactomycetum TaxID=27317 RepID=A0ACB6V1H9_9ASCO|nr:hypothetical protein D0Z00_003368 [Geotrichum candidum]